MRFHPDETARDSKRERNSPEANALYGAASPLPGGSVGIGVRLAAHELRAVTAGLEATWIACRQQLFGAPTPTRRKGTDAALAV